MMPKYRVKNSANAKIFQECFDELSPEAKVEITKIIQELMICIKGCNERIQFSHAMGGELLVALIRGGYLKEKEGSHA